MFLEPAKQFLINANVVSETNHHSIREQLQFEFIFNEKLELIESLQIITATPFSNYKLQPIQDLSNFYRVLFELNHVRVNPKLDNNTIIAMLTNTLNNVGIRINNQPSKDSLAICFQPLGEILDSVRFYLKENKQVVFLSKKKPNLKIIKC